MGFSISNDVEDIIRNGDFINQIKFISMLLFNKYEKKFLKRLPEFNALWAELIIEYCHASPVKMSDKLNHMGQAIRERKFSNVFSGTIGWDLIKYVEKEFLKDEMFKKYFDEGHFVLVLEILIFTLNKLAKDTLDYPASFPIRIYMGAETKKKA